jgi:hypothetical protein
VRVYSINSTTGALTSLNSYVTNGSGAVGLAVSRAIH